MNLYESEGRNRARKERIKKNNGSVGYSSLPSCKPFIFFCAFDQYIVIDFSLSDIYFWLSLSLSACM